MATVALIDADVEAYTDWLRDLVSPLSQPGVGATTGVRWFVPTSTNAGSLVRYVWNSAASTQMNAVSNPLGRVTCGSR